MRFLYVLCLAIALTTAAPGRFQHQYQFQSSSASFKNNELQHKNEEAGRYLKHGETDSDAPPHEESSYMQQEYQKPDTDQTPVDVNSFLDKLKQESQIGQGHRGIGHGLALGHGVHSQQFHQQSSSHYESSSSASHILHGYAHRRPWHRNRPVVPTSSGGRLEEFEDESSDYSRFQAHGFGKEYLENTEGHASATTGKPTTQLATNTINHHGGRHPSPGSRDLITSSSNNRGSAFDVEFGGQEQEDLSQQTQHIFGKDQTQEDLTQQSQTGFGNFDFGSQHKTDEDLTQQTQDGFGEFEFGSNSRDQTNHGSQSQFGHHELTSQGKLDELFKPTETGFGSNQPDYPSKPTNRPQIGFGSNQSSYPSKPTNRPQIGFGSNQPGYPSKPTSRPTTGFGSSSNKPGLAQLGPGSHRPTQDKFEYGNQDLKPQSQTGFGTLEIGSNRPGLATLESGSHHRQNQYGNRETTQQSQTGFGTSSNIAGTATLESGSHRQTQDKFDYGNHDSMQLSHTGFGTNPNRPGLATMKPVIRPSQTGFDKLETGFGQSHQHFDQDLTQQTQTGFGKLDFSDQHEDLSQQTQNFGKSDFENQETTGYDKLEIGSQHQSGFNRHDTTNQYHQSQFAGKPKPRDDDITTTPRSYSHSGNQHRGDISQHHSTQQGHSSFGHHEFGGQEHEDMSQQSQSGFGKFEFGDQKHDDLTQQTQTGFGKLEFGAQEHEDMSQQHMTQQSQSGFGKLEFGDQKRDDFTQQTQSGFGKLEFGAQEHEDMSQQHMTQQVQTGFGKLETGDGKLEIGSGTHRGNLNVGSQTTGHRQYSSSSSSSSSFSQQHATSSAYNHQSGGVIYGLAKPVYEENPDDDQDVKVIDDIEQYAQKVDDVSQQAQKPVDLKKMEKMDDNEESSRDVLEKELIEQLNKEEATTTKKPGFWKRVGSSITSTYETAKEKTKTLAEKVKHNIG